jgi:hypothetical protein
MRKLYFTAAAAAALFTATGAGADSLFSHTVSLSAIAPHVCSFGGTPPAHTGTFAEGITSGSSSLAVAVEADHIEAQEATLTFANVFCNGNNTTLRLKKGGLKVEAATLTAPGFRTEIEYDVSVRWGGVTVVSLSGDETDKPATIGAMNGDLVLKIEVPARTGPFVADTYNDSVVLTVQPTT